MVSPLLVAKSGKTDLCLLPALAIDVTKDALALRPSAIYCANMVHIAPWSACVGLFELAAREGPADRVEVQDLQARYLFALDWQDADAYAAFARDVDLRQLAIDPDEVFGRARDNSRGRRVPL